MVDKRRTFGETVGAKAFPNAQEVKLEYIIGKQVLVKDCVFKKMQFGDVAIMLIDLEGKDSSVLAGGMVVCEKLREAKEKNLLPLLGTIIKEKTYYDIE